MNEETITLLAMIKAMDRGETFSIGFRTYDFKKQSGGEWIYFDQCIKHNHLTRTQLKSIQPVQLNPDRISRNPNHYENSTRNIKVIATGKLVKVHLRLIRRFNNKIVL